MSRPEHLPDFASPPLVEVAVSVQFAELSGYRDIYAGEIRALFDESFSVVEEHPILEPMFEIFGPQPPFGFHFGFPQQIGNRYWLTRPDQSELIQFQKDRFIHNWRKVPVTNNEYPRFENIIERFSNDLNKLDEFFNKKKWGALIPNQCELVYVNQISLIDENGNNLNKSHYLKGIDSEVISNADGFNINVRKVINGEGGAPIGRLYIDASTVTDGLSGNPSLSLNLTMRGVPTTQTKEAAIKFLYDARIKIVNAFTDFTSDSAHEKWRRQ